MNRPVLIIGAGGHAKVLIDSLLASSVLIAGLVDADQARVGTTLLGVPILGGDEFILEFPMVEIQLVNGLGSVGLSAKRRELFERFRNIGYSFATVIHPASVIASDVKLGEGSQIMAGAVIQTGSRIGCNTIVNTRSSIDHDCIIGDHVHIAPGVTLCGEVSIGNECHIGTGTTVIQGVCIGSESLVGAGSLVLKDVPPTVTVVGAPAKVVKK